MDASRHFRRALRSPSTHLMVVALGVLALALASCARDTPVGTAPLAPARGTDPSADLAANRDFSLGTTLGGPIAGLTPDELARFQAGQADFEDNETVEDGLGPVFNEAACAACHNAPIGGTTGRLETRFGRWQQGAFDPLARLGGSLMQDHAIGRVSTDPSHRPYTFVPEVVPRQANQTALRVTTPLFGLGLVDAIPDEALIALAQREPGSVRGKVHMVREVRTGAMRAGRFGWKAQNPTLHQFSGDAYLNEMGITNPEFTVENSPQGDATSMKWNPAPTVNDDGEGVRLVTDFMTLLGPPPRGATNSQTEAGQTVFTNIGCASCHTISQRTGFSPVAAMSNRTFHPYSDFLLHDMGTLGDGIVQGDAGGRDMRTAPLWGLTTRPSFLHDGRATTPEAAILAHDGQGSAARRNFQSLDVRQRQALMAFLKSL